MFLNKEICDVIMIFLLIANNGFFWKGTFSLPLTTVRLNCCKYHLLKNLRKKLKLLNYMDNLSI